MPAPGAERTTLSVVMPAYNEARFLNQAVREVVTGLRELQMRAELLIVENGSTDATAALAKDLADELGEVRVIALEQADYGAALRVGLQSAAGEVVVHFDVDYYDLGFLEQAAALVVAPDGPAIVVASKRAPGARDRRPVHRRLLTASFGLILRRAFGLRVSDTHGMKAVHRKSVAAIVERCRLGRDLFDTELVLRAERAGLGVAELPVVAWERRPSRTSVLRRGVRSAAGLVRLRLALRDP